MPIEVWEPEDFELLKSAGYETDWKHGVEYTVDIPVQVEDRKGKWRVIRVQGAIEDRWFTHKDALNQMLNPGGKKRSLRGDELQVGDILHNRFEVTGKLPQDYRVKVLEVGKRTLKVEYLDADLRHKPGDVINQAYTNAFNYTVERESFEEKDHA